MLRQSGYFLILFSGLAMCGCGTKESTTRWAAFPVAIYMDSKLAQSPGAESDLRAAMDFWEARAGKKLFQYEGVWQGRGSPFSGSAQSPDEIFANVVIAQTPWPFSRETVGQTIVHTEENAIAASLIEINFEVAMCAGDCIGDFLLTSRRKVLAHELGHFLGLGHAGDPGNIMYHITLPGAALDHLQVDADSLAHVTQ